METEDQPTELAGLTARDIATHYTYSADRVQLHVVDESTVLAVGFDPKRPHRATGRVAWLHLRDFWRATRCEPCDGCSVAMYAKDRVDTTDDLDALVRWLRGEA